MLEVQKHIYDYVKTDSKIERKFAQELESGEAIVYAKLPSGFKIPTPVGNYNPDWAIVFETKETKHVYFIAETKGSMGKQLRQSPILEWPIFTKSLSDVLAGDTFETAKYERLLFRLYQVHLWNDIFKLNKN